MWSLPPSDTVLHLLSYVALTAQAMTAALAAGRPQHGLGRRMHARLHYRARRRHHPRRAARALSAGLGAETRPISR
jgi:hypothetical protein